MSTALFVTILAVSSLVTSFISGILGMAGGIILMGILLAMMSVPAAMMMHGITQLASNAWRAFLWRTSSTGASSAATSTAPSRCSCFSP